MSNDWSRRGLLKLAATVAAVPFRRIGLGLQSTMPATESVLASRFGGN